MQEPRTSLERANLGILANIQAHRFKRNLWRIVAHLALLPAIIVIGYAFGKLLAILTQ